MEMKIRIIIEILGSPKEHVQKIMSDVLGELSKREIKILQKNIGEAEKVDKFYSSFAEVEFEVAGMNKLIDICFDFMPSVVEILEPLEMRLQSKAIEELLNDLLAKLHKQSMVMRNMHAENVLMKKQLEKNAK